MKEATGELNMTVVVVVLVAGMVTFFSMTLWPMIKSGIKNEGNCSDAVCDKNHCSNGICNCKYYTNKEKTQSTDIQCPYKG